MNQQLEANRSYVDNLLAQIKEQTAKTQELYTLRMVDRGIIAEQKAEIITLREQRDKLFKAAKEMYAWYGDMADDALMEPGAAEASFQLKAVLEEVEGEK